MQTNTITPNRFPVSKLAWGLLLLVVGAVSFTDGIDLWNPREIWRFWPLALIAVGIAGEVDALRLRKSDGSYIILAIGVWQLAATQRFLGLHYGSAMPLGIAVVGLGLILHALIDIPAPKENDRDER
jgi:cell wall-active antibiotic response 4TMS protein YvqF